MYGSGMDNRAEKRFINRPQIGGFNHILKNHENSVRLHLTIFTAFYVYFWWKT